MYAYFLPVIGCTCVCIGCTPQLCLRGCATCSVWWPVTRSHVTAAVCQNSGTVLQLFHVRLCWVKIDGTQCCQSWTDAELGVHAMMSDTTGASLPSSSAVFYATPWRCRELSDEWYIDHIQYKYGLLRRLTSGIIWNVFTDLKNMYNDFWSSWYCLRCCISSLLTYFEYCLHN